MRKGTAIIVSGALLGLALAVAGCSPVGSERWCRDMEQKPTVDWTPNEAVDYGKHCVG